MFKKSSFRQSLASTRLGARPLGPTACVSDSKKLRVGNCRCAVLPLRCSTSAAGSSATLEYPTNKRRVAYTHIESGWHHGILI
jgi:hypothetical protein